MCNLEKLPDEVLVQILSLLPVNDAVKTCVLSHRWRNLWKFITRLNFVSPEDWRSSYWYVQWVNRVLRIHSCSFVDEFRIDFNIDIPNINVWIKEFLIPKRVKRLEICVDRGYSSKHECILSNLSHINSLTRITLKGDGIDGPLVESLLSNCQHLEFLSVSESTSLLNLNVAGPSVNLKHLEVSKCQYIKSIHLSAPKLATLIYTGYQTYFICSGYTPNFQVGNNPNFCELIIGGGYREVLPLDLGPFSSIRSQLETLRWSVRIVGNKEVPQFLHFNNLKTLILDVSVNYYDSLIGLTSLIEAAPSLKRFTLNLRLLSELSVEIKVPEPLCRPHHCLKRVDIYGFIGGCPDLGLVRYLLKNAINLEKIVVQPFHRHVSYLFPQNFAAEDKKANARRKRARNLNNYLPRGVELVVL